MAKEAIEAAKAANKAVIFAGLPESFESEGYDREHMRLPDCQNRLIEEIIRVQPNTAVVLHNGASIELPWLSKVKGILEAYLGGQAVGEATVNLLYGKVNPSGKLAETFPVKLADNPAYLNFGNGKHVVYHEGVFVGYRYYDTKETEVAFPFGHGLSYTTFSYSNLKTDKESLTDQEILSVSVDVTNTGSVAGKEIVQLYVSDLTKAASRPVKELKGFEKVELQPGETKTVQFKLDGRSFSWYHTGLADWYAASGTYELLAGASSRDIRCRKTIELKSSKTLPLELHLNTTLGELMGDERTKELGRNLKQKLDHFFGGSPQNNVQNEDNQEAGQEDAMGDAIANSMPLRNLVSFGIYPKEELLAELEKWTAK